MIDKNDIDNRKIAGLNREMVYERLPRHLRDHGPTTVEEATFAVTALDEPPDAEHAEMWVIATSKVETGLVALVDAGYADVTADEMGHLVYSATGKIDGASD